MISVMKFSWCLQTTLNRESTSTVNSASAVHVLGDCIEAVSPRHSEAEQNSRLISEVTLVVVTSSKAIAKARQQVINLHGANGDCPANGDVDTAADDEVKRVVAW